MSSKVAYFINQYPKISHAFIRREILALERRGLVTRSRSNDDARVLIEAWRTATRVRNAVVLTRGRASDAMPTDPRSLAAVARAMGYPAGHSQQLLEDYRRVTRRARATYERVFFA